MRKSEVKEKSVRVMKDMNDDSKTVVRSVVAATGRRFRHDVSLHKVP